MRSKKNSIAQKTPKTIRARQCMLYNVNNFNTDLFTYLQDETFSNSSIDPNYI